MCFYRDRMVAVEFTDNETGFLNVYQQRDTKRAKPYYARITDGRQREAAYLARLLFSRSLGGGMQAGPF